MEFFFNLSSTLITFHYDHSKSEELYCKVYETNYYQLIMTEAEAKESFTRDKL
jgi:hypothetical protein